jgi:hypothetical protein
MMEFKKPWGGAMVRMGSKAMNKQATQVGRSWRRKKEYIVHTYKTKKGETEKGSGGGGAMASSYMETRGR